MARVHFTLDVAPHTGVSVHADASPAAVLQTLWDAYTRVTGIQQSSDIGVFIGAAQHHLTEDTPAVEGWLGTLLMEVEVTPHAHDTITYHSAKFVKVDTNTS